jgi:hypothetical protein
MFIPIALGAVALFVLTQVGRQAYADVHIEPDPDPDVLPEEVEEPPIIPVPELPAMPNPGREFGICRVFVLDTADAPVTNDGMRHIERRYKMAAEWVREHVGTHLAYDPDIVHLRMPFSSDEILDEVLNGNLPAKLFEWMATRRGPESAYNPYHERLYWGNQTWQLIVRGAGGYAGALHVDRNNENVSWGIVGDAVLTSWLSEAGLEENICPDVVFTHMTREERIPYCTPDAQTGAFIHETFHGMFWAGHTGINSIMTEWWNWPNNAIDDETASLIPDSPYLL